MKLHVHIDDLNKLDEDGNAADDILVEEQDLLVNDVYPDLDENGKPIQGTGYVQFILDSQHFPGKSIEIRVPVEWLTLRAQREATE